ncbi:16S rRNA (cytosine(1402)-N(4))-methyltransferase, partial [bacterium]
MVVERSEAIVPHHDPAMLAETLAHLALRPGMVVVDGTLGLAGHAVEFVARIAPGGTLVGLDWDQSMLALATERLGSPEGVTLRFVHSDYRGLPEVLEEAGLQADAILLDLGLNSAQIDDPERGIAFSKPGPLDMRMDRSTGEPASAMLNRLAPGEIERGLKEYGDENWARAIAKVIVERRKAAPLRTTADLVDAVLAAIPAGARDRRIHPATRTFQAVRIMVNGELDE